MGTINCQQIYVTNNGAIGRSHGTDYIPFSFGISVVAIAASVCLFWNLGRWAWDVDEVETLQELNLTSGGAADNENSQFARSPRLMPIWYWCQRQVMRYLPLKEGTARLLPAVCGILFVVVSFVWAWRTGGSTFAFLLAAMILASPLFLSLAQQIRFYTMALLFQVLAQIVILRPTKRFHFGWFLLSVLLTVVAILCHNVLLVYFVLAAGATIVCYALGWCDRSVLARSLAAGFVGVCLYLVYLRPVLQGWNSSLPHRTTVHVLISLLSEVGIPMLVLAFLGSVLSIRAADRSRCCYWAMLGAMSIAFMLAAPYVIWFFNYRYTLLFLLPIWVLAARAIRVLGQKLDSSSLRAVWYVCAVVLLLPKVASYYQDGSRRDMRSAANLVSHITEDKPSSVYCNLPAILRYYMPNREIKDWPTENVQEPVALVVLATNAWTTPLSLEGRSVELVATLGQRRFDEQSYLVQVYRLRGR